MSEATCVATYLCCYTVSNQQLTNWWLKHSELAMLTYKKSRMKPGPLPAGTHLSLATTANLIFQPTSTCHRCRTK